MRPIDADELLTHKVMTRWEGYKVSEADINKAPTVDAVPVVRCKDCIHYDDAIKGITVCFVTGFEIEQSDFCSKGKKEI